MSGSEPLKPCPFCGNAAKRVGSGWVGCGKQERGCPGAGFIAAPEDWNRRAPSPVVAEVVKEMRDYTRGFYEGKRSIGEARLADWASRLERGE